MSITIDSITYDVPVVDLKMKGEFLDKYAERTQDGILHRELIGVYFNYEIKFGRTKNTTVFAALWKKLTEPVEFHTIILPDDDGNFTFDGYFANVSASIRKDDTATRKFWKELTASFIAQSPARTP